MKPFAPLFGATIIAVAASACCILPAILGLASVGALGLSAVAPYRPSVDFRAYRACRATVRYDWAKICAPQVRTVIEGSSFLVKDYRHE